MSKIKLSMEVIGFQNDDFASKLESFFIETGKYIEKEKPSRKELQDSEYPKLLEGMIFKRFGIKTNVIMNTTCAGAIMPFFMNKNHVLLKEEWRGDFELKDQEKVLKELFDKKGTIDLKNARVSGIFSEYVHDVYLDLIGNFGMWKMNASEIAAILLHEIGHGFTYYEFSDRLNSTNQVLAELAKEVKGSNDPAKKQYHLREIMRLNDFKDKDFEDLADEENKTIFGLKLFRKYFDIVKSQLANSKYDETASEQLADNFATRFGVGRALITALDKIHTAVTPERNKSLHIFMILVEIFDTIKIISAIIGAFMSGSLVVAVVISMIVGLVIYLSGAADRDMTYDIVKMRYTRIRHQMIEAINTLELPKDKLHKVVADIHSIDDIIKQTRVYNTFSMKIADFIFSKHRNTAKDIQLQYDIEALAHNDLFLKSAELKLQA